MMAGNTEMFRSIITLIHRFVILFKQNQLNTAGRHAVEQERKEKKVNEYISCLKQ